jgi:uncharacterized protein (DUF3084 family)
MGAILGLLLLLTLCGFIAYTGDLLGRRLGKKRLSVFGLRPKHTAILLTIVTGVLIAGVTFGAAMASVPGFRRLVMEGERLARINRRLEKQNGERQQQNEALAEKNQDLTTTNQSLSRHSAELRSRNTMLQGENQKLMGSKEQLSRANAQLLASNRGLAEQNRGLQGKNAELDRKNAGLDREIAGLRSTRERLSRDAKRLGTEVHALHGVVRGLRTELTDLEQEEYIFRRGQRVVRRPVPPNPPVEVLREAVKGVLWEAEERARGASTKLRSNQRATLPVDGKGRAVDRAAFQDQIVGKALAMRNKAVVLEVVAAENCVNGRTVPVLLDCYLNEPVFKKGAEIARRAVDGAASEGLILGDLVSFLRSQVRGAATRKGMVPTEEMLGELSYDQLLAACRQIKQIDGPAVVRARVRQDTLRAGPLNIDLEVGAIRETRAGTL